MAIVGVGTGEEGAWAKVRTAGEAGLTVAPGETEVVETAQVRRVCYRLER